MEKAYTSIVQDKRIRRKNGTYAIKLRVTYQRRQKYYPTKIHLNPEDWEKTQSLKPRNKYKKFRVYFAQIEQKALDIIDKLSPFSFSEFENRFNQKKQDGTNPVIHSFNEYIENLKKEQRFGTADSYKCSKNSIEKYLISINRKSLLFSELTVNWLNEYERWMLNNGRSITTVGIYIRCLRTILNIAKEKGLISVQSYPFGRRKYQIPAGRNIKKALSLAEIKKIIEYKPNSKAEERARDLWIFSYLANGANIKDIALLKWNNIEAQKIVFIRAKTQKSTKHLSKSIVIIRNEKMNEIINKWGKPSTDQNDFVFDILDKNISPELVMPKVRQASKTINKYMKRISENLKLTSIPTTYSARHSYATVLKRFGTPLEVISENLGHTDLKTTENYLASFEDTTLKKYSEKLLDFSNLD